MNTETYRDALNLSSRMYDVFTTEDFEIKNKVGLVDLIEPNDSEAYYSMIEDLDEILDLKINEQLLIEYRYRTDKIFIKRIN